MGDARREKTMSLELAIQRELAYREKVAGLKIPKKEDFLKDLQPLEIQSSRPTVRPSPVKSYSSQIQSSIPNASQRYATVGMKREAPELSLKTTPPVSPIHPDEQGEMDYSFCKTCQVTCSSMFNYKQHRNGKKHKLKVQELRRGKKKFGDHYEATSKRHHCDLCKIWCMNKDLFNMHLQGKNHKANLELAKTGDSGGANLQRWSHNGKRHSKAELQRLKHVRKGRTCTPYQQARCDTCGIWCTDKSSLELHLRGKKHILRLHELKRIRL